MIFEQRPHCFECTSFSVSLLSPSEKKLHVQLLMHYLLHFFNRSRSLLKKHEREDGGILKHGVNANECSVHYFKPEQKRLAKNGAIPSHHNPLEVMHSGVWTKGNADAIFGSPKPTCRALHVQANHNYSASYFDLLSNHLRPPSKFKHCGLLSTTIYMQHGNIRPCTARVTAETFFDIHLGAPPSSYYPPELVFSD